MYPASVTELSTLLMHAHKESLQICGDADVKPHTPSPWETESRAVFKKSHTCGSLFVKCGCNNENTDGQSLFHTFSDPYSSFPYKRSSNPSVSAVYTKSINKRLSNPEISNTQFLEKRATGYSNRPKSEDHFLQHPEIPYPIPKEACDRSVPSSRKSSNHKENTDYSPELYCRRSNLDYHKCTVLAYENSRQDLEEAQKILREFGILDSMGNGVPLRQNSKPAQENITTAKQQARRSFKNLNNEFSGKNKSGEDNEYLISVITKLKTELSELEIKYGSLHSELVQTQKQLDNKESEVLRLQREIHKLKVSCIDIR